MAGIIRINKQDKLFTRLRWACLAVGHNNPTRPALNLLHVETKGKRRQFTGCDSHRIHRFTSDDSLEFKDTGCNLYTVSKITKSELNLIKNDYKDPYPDIDKLIPKNNSIVESVAFTYNSSLASISALYAAAIRLLEPKWAVNMDLFAELFTAGIAEYAAIKKANVNDVPYILLEAENLLGLLTPLKIENVDLIIEEREKTPDGSELLD